MNRNTSEVGQDSHDVVIIGAGFVGVATALWLQRQGHKVTLVDQDPFTEGAYYGNACTIATYANIPIGTPGIIKQVPGLLFNPQSPLSIRWSYLPRLSPWLCKFLLASTPNKVEDIARQLGILLSEVNGAFEPIFKESDAHELLDINGAMYLYGSQQSFTNARTDIELRRRNGIPVQELSQGDISDLEPNLNPIYHRGLLFNDAYHVRNPLLLLKKMGDAVRKKGGRIVTGKVLHIKRVSATELSVDTDNGNIQGNKVVVAAGAWSKQFASQIGDSVPLDTEQGYHVMYNGAQELLSRPVGWDDVGFYMTPMDTALRAAGTVELGGLNNPSNPKRVKLIADTVKTLLPQLNDYDSQWTGYRPSMPDSMPVIGPSAKDKDVFYAFGHGHLGMTLSGITGKIIADLISQKDPVVDIHPFRVDRF
ncbi:NAD(P)/FAD-dependent oxidoreductase [Neptunomonas antarctica]|uniref:D-amino-acid dehydrogenase n=1 Tax=Neptunomonas antarctica TaxID=619304 RepID=A0A1N7LZG9_9GAMM|nr:FAD-binding oxidoreductase [Neptunomonas antarctica]SIS79101.1 D-amino-acid dehydrogenase [Neptunomonas antarctica]